MSRIYSGTHHFRSWGDAHLYYYLNGEVSMAAAREEVSTRVTEGSVAIGKPKLQPGQTLHVDEDGRYHIGTRC